MHEATRIQHEGEDREAFGGCMSPPVFRSSLFTFPDCESFERSYGGDSERALYTRVANPTTRVLETKIARLESADDAIAFASGMGAVTATLLGLLDAGDHLVLSSTAYGPTLAFADGTLRRLGVEVSRVAPHDLASLASHLRGNTRLVYLESPASWTFELTDLAAVTAVARQRGIPTAIDNSWATPLLQRPLEHGVDLVVHSMTKYINGHSDVVAGLVAGKEEGDYLARVRSQAILLGATLSPVDAAAILRGLRTLPLRIRQHQDSALELARHLDGHPRVRDVFHPALGTGRQAELARELLHGTSGLFAFVLDGDSRRFVDALEHFGIGVSWGGFESLALPVDSLFSRSEERRLRPDVPPSTIRLSIGLEDVADLREDLERGFRAIARQ